MDGRRFDALVQRLAVSSSRRSVVRNGVAFGAALALNRSRHSAAQTPCAFAQVDCFINQICVDGFCEDCPDGLSPCQTYCADLLNDPENCLFCGNVCASGVCEQSQCRENATCDPGLTNCTGQCVNLLTDRNNCGVCGEICEGVSGEGFESPAQCVQGVCSTVCPPGAELCGAECIDVASDSLNCGSCGNRCIVGALCCSGRCVSDGSAERYCEDCGIDAGWTQGCVDDEICERGLCVAAPACEEGLTECGEGNCVDLESDSAHCGVCGNVCPETQCILGECQEPPPAEFADGADAISYLLDIERINESLLRAGLAMPEVEFDEATRMRLETMLGNDAGHISMLREVMTDLGGNQSEDELPVPAIPEDADLFVQRFSRAKELCVSAYVDVLERVPSMAGSAGVASIVGVEARHAAFLAMLAENAPFTSDTESAMSRPEVLSQLETLWRG